MQRREPIKNRGGRKVEVPRLSFRFLSLDRQNTAKVPDGSKVAMDEGATLRTVRDDDFRFLVQKAWKTVAGR